MAGALLWKADLLDEIEKSDEALVTLDQLVARFGSAEDPVVRQRLASGMATKAVILHRLGRYNEAVEACSDLGRRFPAPVAPKIFSYVSHGLLYQGMAFEDLDQPDDAISAYRRLLDRVSQGERGASEETATYARSRLELLLGTDRN